MKKIIILFLFIITNTLLKGQNNVLFTTDGAVGNEGQIVNVPNNPPSKKSTYFKVDDNTNVLPDTLLHSKKINLCVTEDCVIQFLDDDNMTVIMPSMEGTRWAWEGFYGNNDKEKYSQWLRKRLSAIHVKLDSYAEKLLKAKESTRDKNMTALWMIKVNTCILAARLELLK